MILLVKFISISVIWTLYMLYNISYWKEEGTAFTLNFAVIKQIVGNSEREEIYIMIREKQTYWNYINKKIK